LTLSLMTMLLIRPTTPDLGVVLSLAQGLGTTGADLVREVERGLAQ